MSERIVNFKAAGTGSANLPQRIRRIARRLFTVQEAGQCIQLWQSPHAKTTPASGNISARNVAHQAETSEIRFRYIRNLPRKDCNGRIAAAAWHLRKLARLLLFFRPLH
ncbi:hypothetical protein [Rhodoplanes sp. Z2-YC6860]|uniref:hypothetical protein n=1 Tax=Rhodoplanes sp. Z2-YC6860 TaxID=674703 RepID=UPI0018DCF700|nr:hypothetical protein [Rhodoplanes sp. Z2-YC6860]